MKRLLILICLLVALNHILPVHSICNLCNSGSNTACVSVTEFQFCKNNVPYGNILDCNPGEYCSVLGGCGASIDFADCQECELCNKNKTFACLDTRKFALCLGDEDYNSEMTGQCSEGYVCNYKNPDICGKKDATIATCPYTADPKPEPTTTEPPTTLAPTTTTPSPQHDPNGFCKWIQQEGRYPVGRNPANTCKQFVSCITINGEWYGPIYNCPGSTYFDYSVRECVANIPATCSSRISSISFRGILLD